MEYDIYPTLPGLELATCSITSVPIPLSHNDGQIDFISVMIIHRHVTHILLKSYLEEDASETIDDGSKRLRDPREEIRMDHSGMQSIHGNS